MYFFLSGTGTGHRFPPAALERLEKTKRTGESELAVGFTSCFILQAFGVNFLWLFALSTVIYVFIFLTQMSTVTSKRARVTRCSACQSVCDQYKCSQFPYWSVNMFSLDILTLESIYGLILEDLQSSVFSLEVVVWVTTINEYPSICQISIQFCVIGHCGVNSLDAEALIEQCRLG